ncbi:ectonucleotide pyrophosphatase/phosphodiesterase family member 5 [Patella vulgata]|uniref:ectonucleotide pyrophosphatase/phosphodiesterase family member 5 n=1 Tax=Patella vulgata TaxID=6465 RepID=UPI0024A8F3E9|nr:ectonucleotide pyrophosphatase/phosphodiesterase family member 5 [Patella vulgata]
MNWLLVLLPLIGFCGVTGRPKKYVDKVLLVSMDGFRWDYLDKIDTPHFDYLADHGVKVRYVNNTFITETFPCHYSIATGLYEESHGIIANKMYDPVFNETFGMANHDPKWWEAGEPIWITATKQNMKSATYFWPGSEVAIKGVRPEIWYPYNESVPFEERIDTVMDWFANQGVHLATLYFHEPDHTGHLYGPDSQQIKDKVVYMDNILGYLLGKLRENQLWDSVNVIITSDHGMTSVDVDTQNILPEDGQVDTVYQSLKNQSDAMHLTVYKKEDIPEHYHYKNNRRVMPVVALADEGWLVVDNKHRYDYHPGGAHGYNNQFMSMKPIFLAHGPNFKSNYRQESIKNVDIYPLICELLGVVASPNNGSLSNTEDMLRDSEYIIG